MTDEAWCASFRELAVIADVDPIPPSAWPKRENRIRHLCRLLAFELDEVEPGGRRHDLARAYARAYGLLVESGHRHSETFRPPP